MRLDITVPGEPPGPIVVAVDGTVDSMQAVHWAAMRARTSGADIHILHAYRWRSYPLEYGMAELHDLSGQEAGQDICRSAVDLATATAPGSRITGSLVSGTAGPAIVQATADAALLVLGGSRLGVVRTQLRAPTLPYVISRIRCSVAVVPVETSQAASVSSPPRVSVGVDGGAGDTAALTEALRTAHADGYGVLVVCAAGAEQATATTLRRVRRHIPVSDVERMTASGRIVDTLTRLEPSSMAVVCDRSQVALTGPWRGRAGRRLLNDARCPVLLTCAPDDGGRVR